MAVDTKTLPCCFEPLPRVKADELLNQGGPRDGRFLIRQRSKDSAEYVLGVVYKGRPTHHLIQKNNEGHVLVNKKLVGGSAVSDVWSLLKLLSQPTARDWPVPLTEAVCVNSNICSMTDFIRSIEAKEQAEPISHLLGDMKPVLSSETNDFTALGTEKRINGILQIEEQRRLEQEKRAHAEEEEKKEQQRRLEQEEQQRRLEQEKRARAEEEEKKEHQRRLEQEKRARVEEEEEKEQQRRLEQEKRAREEDGQERNRIKDHAAFDHGINTVSTIDSYLLTSTLGQGENIKERNLFPPNQNVLPDQGTFQTPPQQERTDYIDSSLPEQVRHTLLRAEETAHHIATKKEDLRRMDSLQERFGVHLGQVPGTSSSDSTSSVSLRLNQSLAKAVIKLGARVTALESKVDQLTFTVSDLTTLLRQQLPRRP
eukprot:gene9621-1842_t